MLTEAQESTRSATAFMPLACRALSITSSLTVQPKSWMEGKERMGMGFFTGEVRMSSSHFCTFIKRSLLLFNVNVEFIKVSRFTSSIAGKATACW